MQYCGSRTSRPSSRIVLPARRFLVAVLLTGAALAVAAGCGKKGAPLPPLVRIPEAVTLVATRRTGNDAYVTLRLPAKNVDGSTPVTFSAVEVLALTADRPPSQALFLDRGTLVATFAMAAPPAAPAAAAPPATSPSAQSSTAGASASPGDEVTVRETLTDEMFVPVALPAGTATPPGVAPPAQSGASPPAQPDAARPAPEAPSQADSTTTPALRRYYLALTRDARKRPGPSGTIASVSLSALPDAPGNVQVAYTEQTTTVTWSPVAGATGYNIYTESPDGSPSPPSRSVTPPRPLNASRLDKPTYAEPIRFGEPACYRVRAVRGTAAELSEGPPSAAGCGPPPRDSFPPAAPDDIRAVPGSGEITVEWSPVVAADLAGYLVLRGTAGDDTLQPITAAPIRELRFVDSSVKPGVRYVYAVVAVDSAANRSAASERYEATAR